MNAVYERFRGCWSSFYRSGASLMASTHGRRSTTLGANCSAIDGSHFIHTCLTTHISVVISTGRQTHPLFVSGRPLVQIRLGAPLLQVFTCKIRQLCCRITLSWLTAGVTFSPSVSRRDPQLDLVERIAQCARAERRAHSSTGLMSSEANREWWIPNARPDALRIALPD